MDEQTKTISPEQTSGTDSTEKPDLLDYLESLPDVDDPFEPSEPEPEPETPSELSMLADYIRARAASGLLTAKSALLQESPELEALIPQLLETFDDLRTEQGNKDLYFYATPIMAVNYAHMAMLAEEKDYSRTIADIVRWNCKIGPACTAVYFFTSAPYCMTKTQIDVTLNLMKTREAYADIQETKSFNGVRYLYTTQRLSAKYAKALADFAEEGEQNM